MTTPVPNPGRRARYASGLPVRRLGGRRQADEAFELLIDRFTEHLTENEYRSAATGHTYAKWARNYHQWLQTAYPDLPIEAASPATLRKFLAFKRGQMVKASTLATILHSLRSFYSFTLAGDPDHPNPTLGVRPPRVIAPAIDPYSEQEIRHLLALAQRYEHSPDLRRWLGYVALTILAGTGIRNGELPGLQTADVDLVRHRLRVVGKGSKPRTVPFGPATAAVLATYLEDLRPRLPQSPYFMANPRSLRQGPFWGRLEPNTLVGLVRDLLAETGIPGRHFPHRFRHSFASNALREAGNIEVVRELLGHTDITTTGRYLHATMADKHQAADGIDFAAVSDPTPPPPAARPEAPPGRVPAPASNPRAPVPPREVPASLPNPLLSNLAEEGVARALQSARRLPAGTLSRLTSRRLAEAAVGTLKAASIDSDLLEAAAALVLSRANHVPVPLAPLLKAHGPEALTAIDRAGATLELLADGEAGSGQAATLQP
ncbi:MAG: tyrosine-type recombinase/integrase [Candidatus Dormibacteria bacterium]